VRAGSGGGMAAGVVQARRILDQPRASVVGFGGYPCVAPVLATRLMRRGPTVILHEQRGARPRQPSGAPPICWH
jgi:UDP-N-acetylglucosamine--N-acetylmuramyl-(pentapeptide) pyrophosphoryl-undecaprenol N-acetylglucosamine transferase